MPLFLENELLHEDVNKFAFLARSPQPVNTLYETTQGQPESSARFRDILRPHRMGDELRVALRDRRHSWGFMCLHREAGGRPFSSEEQRWLRQLGPHLAGGLRQSLLLTRENAADGPSVPGVLIVTAGLERVSISSSAEAWLAEIDDWVHLGARSLPIVAVVSRLLAIEQTVSDAVDRLPRIRVQTRTGRWLTLSASRLAQASEADHIAVIVAVTQRTARAPSARSARAHRRGNEDRSVRAAGVQQQGDRARTLHHAADRATTSQRGVREGERA